MRERATWATCSRLLFCSGHYFIKIDGSELLKSLFKKEQMSEERREHFTLGHKKEEKLSKTCEKYELIERIACFCKQFTGIMSESLTSLFFKERHKQIAHCHSLKWAILRDRAKEQTSYPALERWSDARLVGRVSCWQVQCRGLKTEHYEDKPLCPSGYMYCFSIGGMQENIFHYYLNGLKNAKSLT